MCLRVRSNGVCNKWSAGETSVKFILIRRNRKRSSKEEFHQYFTTNHFAGACHSSTFGDIPQSGQESLLSLLLDSAAAVSSSSEMGEKYISSLYGYDSLNRGRGLT